MTREEDIIVNSTDPTTVRLRAEIQSDKLNKPSSFMQEQFTPERLEDLANSEAAYFEEQQAIENGIIRQKKIDERAAQTAKRKQEVTITPKSKSTLKVGKTVPQKTTQTQAQINLETAKANLEAAKARGMALGPADEAAEYAEKKTAGYFDNDYFNDLNDDYFENLKSSEAGYADDIIEESFDALNHSSATIANGNIDNLTGSAASIVKSSGTRANPLLSSAVSKGGPLNLRNAALAATLGLGVGYANSRRNTRR
ncbi:hypothetical protein [Flavobacterium sp.]|uniref:hypothetical protein n=1 Tax=Flavobacterium sp. TaxID=239 RepID=UPI003BC4D330